MNATRAGQVLRLSSRSYPNRGISCLLVSWMKAICRGESTLRKRPIESVEIVCGGRGPYELLLLWKL